MTDADVLPGAEEDACARKDLLSEGVLKLFFRTVDPARAQTKGFGGEHHCRDGDASVDEVVRIVSVGDDEQDDGGAVEGIKALLPVPDLAV